MNIEQLAIDKDLQETIAAIAICIRRLDRGISEEKAIRFAREAVQVIEDRTRVLQDLGLIDRL